MNTRKLKRGAQGLLILTGVIGGNIVLWALFIAGVYFTLKKLGAL